MSRYIVVSLSPSGEHQFLHRGRMGSPLAATHYSHPSQALRALDAFVARLADPRDWRLDVIDCRTGKSHYGTADDVLAIGGSKNG